MSDFNIKICCDPEVFVKNSRGVLISAHDMIPGTKAEPHKVFRGAVQVDGMALEFNIDPADNYSTFQGNITSVLEQMKSMIPSSYRLAFQPVAEFGKEYIEAQPIKAKELGCEPDFNAYTMKPNPMPNGNNGFRTASGHIHIGWTENEDINNPEHLEACQMVVKQLDNSLGIAEDLWCPPNIRRELYGNFGAFRPKPYGVEYRVLNNTWVKSAKLTRLVYELAHKAVTDLYNGQPHYNKNLNPADDTILSKYDKLSAWYGSVFLKIFGHRWYDVPESWYGNDRNPSVERKYLS